MNKAIRHWKQHLDINAELILLKNLTFAGKKMKAGDPITEEMRKTLGPYKLRLWWEAKMIQVQMATPPAKPQVMANKPKAPKALKPKAPKKAPKKTLPTEGDL